MSDFSRFRTAVGGFSRTDVVNYIEETSAAHQKALRKLEDEKQQEVNSFGQYNALAQALAQAKAQPEGAEASPEDEPEEKAGEGA